jgi:hypothetical protein
MRRSLFCRPTTTSRYAVNSYAHGAEAAGVGRYQSRQIICINFIWRVYQIHKTVARVRQLGARRVALQFPEGLLMYACVIADILERCLLSAVSSNVLLLGVGVSSCLHQGDSIEVSTVSRLMYVRCKLYRSLLLTGRRVRVQPQCACAQHAPAQWYDQDRDVVQGGTVVGGLLQRLRHLLRRGWRTPLRRPAAILARDEAGLGAAGSAPCQLLLLLLLLLVRRRLRRCRRDRRWSVSWAERDCCRLLSQLERRRPAACHSRGCGAHLRGAQLLQQPIRCKDQKLVACSRTEC